MLFVAVAVERCEDLASAVRQIERRRKQARARNDAQGTQTRHQLTLVRFANALFGC